MESKIKMWALYFLALVIGLLIAWIDSSPGWDDDGITAFVILGVTASMGFFSPGKPWLWALLVTVWIPLYAITSTHNYTSFLALAIGFVGAYAGALAARNIKTMKKD